MRIQEIRAIARERGLKPGVTSKAALIRAIQRDEGNFDCFGRADSNYCDQEACLWRTDCLPAARKDA
jgi:hypothetical protein